MPGSGAKDGDPAKGGGKSGDKAGGKPAAAAAAPSPGKPTDLGPKRTP
ncbi:MAG: hypothetical protein IPL88_16410 [Rhizobiales bacterium]|nr:hypothetical protein [Hyphomicrobiales bacterium]